jgi:hypothetical protein
MSSLHQSRARVLFDAACAFGLAASCAFAWMQTYATAFLPMAGIVGLFGLVRLSDLRQPAVSGDAEGLAVVTRSVPKPVAAPEPEPVATYVQPPIEDVLAIVKRSRKSPKAAKAKKTPASAPVEQAAPPPLPVVDEPTPVEPEAPLVLEQPTADVVQHPAHAETQEPEPDYAPPVVPLFEAEPFVRNPRRAAFGRKAG